MLLYVTDYLVPETFSYTSKASAFYFHDFFINLCLSHIQSNACHVFFHTVSSSPDCATSAEIPRKRDRFEEVLGTDSRSCHGTAFHILVQ